MGRAIDSRLIDAYSPEQINENQHRILDIVDAKTAATQAANATANATDLATAIALANALKTDLNGILTKLKAAGLML